MHRSLFACVTILAFVSFAVADRVSAGSEKQAGGAIVEDVPQEAPLPPESKEPGVPERGETHWFIVGSIGLMALAMIVGWLVTLRRSTANPV